MAQSNKASDSAKEALVIYKEMFSDELQELKKENKEIATCVTEIRAVIPYLATKTDITSELDKVMDRHVEQFHRSNADKPISRPIIAGDNYKKIVGSLIAVIAALVAVIYFLIGQPDPAKSHPEKPESSQTDSTKAN